MTGIVFVEGENLCPNFFICFLIIYTEVAVTAEAGKLFKEYIAHLLFRSNAKFVELLQREPELWYDVAASPVLASLTPEQSEQSKICNFSSEHVTHLNSLQIPHDFSMLTLIFPIPSLFLLL